VQQQQRHDEEEMVRQGVSRYFVLITTHQSVIPGGTPLRSGKSQSSNERHDYADKAQRQVVQRLSRQSVTSRRNFESRAPVIVLGTLLAGAKSQKRRSTECSWLLHYADNPLYILLFPFVREFVNITEDFLLYRGMVKSLATKTKTNS
jgi:uncharacterized MAPEG superfamily protein